MKREVRHGREPLLSRGGPVWYGAVCVLNIASHQQEHVHTDTFERNKDAELFQLGEVISYEFYSGKLGWLVLIF